MKSVSPVAAVVLAALLVAAAPARADGGTGHCEIDNSAPIWWVLTVGEYSLVIGSVAIATAVALAGGDSSGLNIGGLLSAVSFVMAIGAGFESIDKKWDPRIAIGMHEALWLGGQSAALGMVVGAIALQWPLYGSIPLAVALGLAGAAGGAAVGGWFIQSDLEATIAYLAPLASAAAVGLVWLTGSSWRPTPLDPSADAALAGAIWAAAALPPLAAALFALLYPGGNLDR